MTRGAGASPAQRRRTAARRFVHARDAKQLEACNIDGKPARDQERKHGEAR
jgi:hypothetical protein